MKEHAPTPYEVERWSDKGGLRGISIKDGDGACIANMVMDLRDRELATAKYLVDCANGEELRTALAELAFAEHDRDAAQRLADELTVALGGLLNGMAEGHPSGASKIYTNCAAVDYARQIFAKAAGLKTEVAA